MRASMCSEVAYLLIALDYLGLVHIDLDSTGHVLVGIDTSVTVGRSDETTDGYSRSRIIADVPPL